MSGFSKILAERKATCLTPAISAALEISYDDCDCCCHDQHAPGDVFQPTTTTHLSGSEEYLQSNIKVDDSVLQRMTADVIIARIAWETTKKRTEREAHLKKRLAEIHKIMELEKKLHAEWRATMKEKFEEVEALKRAILAKMRLKSRLGMLKKADAMKEPMSSVVRMERITGEFIIALMCNSFDKQIEDVYGARTRILRTVIKGDEWAGPEDFSVRMGPV